MVLLPDCRGQGIGAALLRHAICAARDAGVLRLTLLTDPDNAAAQAIYAAEGFKFSAMQAMRLTLR
jgi:ribosomal protein S18 acetylase RimI-like enzyme